MKKNLLMVVLLTSSQIVCSRAEPFKPHHQRGRIQPLYG